MFYRLNYTGVSTPGGVDPITKVKTGSKHFYTIVGMSEEDRALYASECISKDGKNYYADDEKSGLPLFSSLGFQHEGEIYVTRASKPNNKGVHTWYAISSEEEFAKLCEERPYMLASPFAIDELRKLAVKRVRDRVKTVVKATVIQDESEDSF